MMIQHYLFAAAILCVTLWNAHTAGAAWAQSRSDRAYRGGAIIRTIISIAFGAFLIWYGHGS
jgi:hypothetical protein